MENHKSVDQHLIRLMLFLAAHRDHLERQGAIVRTYRCRGERKSGPYFLLVVRDDRDRQRSLYLGGEGPLVVAARGKLANLQAQKTARRHLANVRQQLRRELAAVTKEFGQELIKIGLTKKGNEIRGWSAKLKPEWTAAITAAARKDA